MKRRIAFFLITILTLAFALTGCKKTHEEIKDYEFAPQNNTEVVEPETSDKPDGEQTGGVDNQQTEEIHTEDQTKEEPGEETTELLITFINLCGADIGMISVVDPVTDEEMEAGALAANVAMNITIEWPMKNTSFVFCVYNRAGELVATSEVDITGVQESVTVTLSGDGNLENVTSAID